MQLYNVFQILGQEINNLRDDLTKAFTVQEDKINSINDSKNEVNKQCYKFYEEWQKENSINKENINNVLNVMDENNNKIENEINCQSKKLDESIMKNELENNNIKKKIILIWRETKMMEMKN